MRKFFALALAVAMVLSLASVSFAADALPNDGLSDIVLSQFYKYSADSDKLDQGAARQYGKAYYAVIYEGKGAYDDVDDDEAISAGDTYTITYAPITKYDDVEKLKIKTEFEMGEDLVESVSIVKKSFDASGAAIPTETVKTGVEYTYVDATNGWNTSTPTAAGNTYAGETLNGYYYCVEIKTKAERVTADADIIGTFEFNRKADTKKKVAKIDDDEVDFNFNIFYENNYQKNYTKDATGSNVTGTDQAIYKIDAEDSVTLKWDDLYALKFDNDDEIEIEFGTDPNEGTFTVDVSGQGKIVIDFNTKANDAICDANPGVKMDFINFNGAKFNRTGEFEYEMEDMVAAYKVVDGQLVEINGLEISSDTATFSTRTLGNYVFATAELVNPAPVAAEAPVAEAPAVTNPSTGAAA